MTKPRFAGMGAYTYVRDQITRSYGPGRTITMKQAGGQNREYLSAEATVLKPIQKQIENNEIPADERLQLHAELYADHVIVGWRGFEFEDGTEAPCNRENVIALFTQCEPLFDDVVADATDKKNFVGSGNENATKNSSKPSSGK